MAKRLWLLVDGLHLQAAYRDHLDGEPDAAVDIAIDLARGLVVEART